MHLVTGLELNHDQVDTKTSAAQRSELHQLVQPIPGSVVRKVSFKEDDGAQSEAEHSAVHLQEGESTS